MADEWKEGIWRGLRMEVVKGGRAEGEREREKVVERNRVGW